MSALDRLTELTLRLVQLQNTKSPDEARRLSEVLMANELERLRPGLLEFTQAYTNGVPYVPTVPSRLTPLPPKFTPQQHTVYNLAVKFERGLPMQRSIEVTKVTTVAEAELLYAKAIGLERATDLIRFKWSGETLHQKDPVLKNKNPRHNPDPILVPDRHYAVKFVWKGSSQENVLDIPLSLSVQGFKKVVWQRTGYPVSQQRVFLNDTELQEGNSVLLEYLRSSEPRLVVDLGPTPTESFQVNVQGVAVGPIAIYQVTSVRDLKVALLHYLPDQTKSYVLKLGDRKLKDDEIVWPTLVEYNAGREPSMWTALTIAQV